MNDEQWTAYLNDIMDRQIKTAMNRNVIFSVSLSNTQVRVCVEPLGQKCYQFFLYRKASEETAKKVLQKIDEYLANMKEWEGFKKRGYESEGYQHR